MLKLKTIKADNIAGFNLALKKFLDDGWSVAKAHYQREIKGQIFHYVDMAKEEIDKESINE